MLPVVLVVDDDERARRLVRMGLELEGMAVVEAESLQRARNVIHRNVAGVVLDRQLPDGDGLELLPVIGTTCPDAHVVLHSTLRDGREPTGMATADKGDLPAIVAALDLIEPPADGYLPHLAVVDLVRAEAEQVAREWEELCQWDPLLPPDSSPPLARLVVDAIAEALQRPQPLGWGPDPALARVTEMFASSVGAIDIAVGQLVCLREAFHRHISGHVPAAEEAESRARVDMIIDRAIWSASRIAAARMERQLEVDPVTGLANRHAFDRDVERELNRSHRYRRPLSVVLAALPAPPGGDAVLVSDDALDSALEAQVRRIAGILATNVRGQDVVYRTGRMTFAIVLPETDIDGAAAIVRRLRSTPMPGMQCAAATYPDDGDDVVTILHEAERRRVSTSV